VTAHQTGHIAQLIYDLLLNSTLMHFSHMWYRFTITN